MTLLVRFARVLDFALVLVWFLIALDVCARPAYAYADPGAGLFLMQVVGSTFLGFTFIVRNRIRRALDRFSKPKKALPIDTAS